MASVPDFIREAMEAAGVNPDVVAEVAADPIPTDAEAFAQQAIKAHGGPVCVNCREPTNPHARGVLMEVTGWHQPREQGGQNHVIARVETGRVMCPTCAIRFRHTGHAGQDTLL